MLSEKLYLIIVGSIIGPNSVFQSKCKISALIKVMWNSNSLCYYIIMTFIIIMT